MTQYRIRRDDGVSDSITKRLYASYNEAHQELERYYADLCCSDDREYYRIEEDTSARGTQSTFWLTCPLSSGPSADGA
jgi:hypothetical protein